MKKIANTALIIALTIGFLYVPQKSYSQLDAQEVNENQIVYWFNIGVNMRKHKKFGYKYYEVRSYGGHIYNAPLKKYGRKLWRGLRRGRYFSIGPFIDYYEAEQAEKFYGRDSIIIDTALDQSKTVYWFMLKVFRRPRSNSYDIMKTPTMVQQGTYRLFANQYKALLSQGQGSALLVGPFWNYDEAEEAKRRYRLQSSGLRSN